MNMLSIWPKRPWWSGRRPLPRSSRAAFFMPWRAMPRRPAARKSRSTWAAARPSGSHWRRPASS